MTVAQFPSALENVTLRAPLSLKLGPDLFAEAIEKPPMTTANQLTCVVEMRGPFVLQKLPGPDVEFDVVAYRVLPTEALGSTPAVVKRVHFGGAGGTQVVRFAFPTIEDDGRFAYVVVVDLNHEVQESNEGETGPVPGSYTAGNIVIAYGPNW